MDNLSSPSQSLSHSLPHCLSLEMWFFPNQHAVPSLQKRGPMPIGRVTRQQWFRLSGSRGEIRVYGGRYIATRRLSR